ncbi:unnamed protein product [Linum trigynum]|uniref:Integrase zinc-binding domain-containing protein n=1 Tax=Linum trigynum TaxID=586398 RepID=A0AAV2DWN1_9ROSI
MSDGHPITFEIRKVKETERRYTVQPKEMTFMVHCLFTCGHYSVVDTLSRKSASASIRQPVFLFKEQIVEGLGHDPIAKIVGEYIEKGKKRRSWMKDGLIISKEMRVFMPRWANLRKEINKECHDSKWVGHPSIERTKAVIEEAYYWPRMRDDVEMYVKTCLLCQ